MDRLVARAGQINGSSDGQVVSGLSTVLTGLNKTDAGLQAYNPVVFAQSVFKNMFAGSVGQQDAQEFFALLWQRLQTQNIIPNSTPAQGIIEKDWEKFHGVSVGSRLICADCKSGRLSPPDPERSCFLSLALPAVPAQAAVLRQGMTLPKLLKDFAAQETLKGDNAVDCDTCGEKTTHTKQLEFLINPAQNFLVMQLKRFGYDFATGTKTKRYEPLTLPESGMVEITDSGGVKSTFRVSGVVVHSGAFGGGHYWAVTPEGVYNDDRATLDGGAGMKTVLTTGVHGGGQGYLYFLERV